MVRTVGTFGRQDHRILLGALILAFAVAVTALSSDRALASHVSCGDTITADTTLDSDLINCPADGIVIGADDITLDLNGHTVDGALAGDFNGIDNTAGHDGVTIENGSVREFVEGVFILGATDNHVRGLSTSHHNHGGIVVADSSNVRVERNSSFSNVAGIILGDSSDVTVEHNVVSDSELGGIPVFRSDHVVVANNSVSGSGSSGIYLFDSDRNRIKRNVSTENNDVGVHLEDGSDRNRVKRNRTVRNEFAGIVLEGSDRNRVRHNRCARNAVCLLVAPGNRNLIARNRIVGGEAGIGIEKGRGNVVARNVVAHPRKVGIYLGLNHPPIGGGHNIVRRNRVRDSGKDGFVVRKTDANSLFNRNLATGAAEDGFDVESRTAKLTGNRAMRNADLGIEGVSGMIDGGENIARANGDPRQCTHIFCG